MAATLLDRLLTAGITVAMLPGGKVRLVGVSALPEHLRDEIKVPENREEFKAHVAARWCHRCQTVKARTIPTYWDEQVRLCPDCCLSLAVEFERSR
jgi:hypothetical protein